MTKNETDLLQRFGQANEILVILIHPEGGGDCFVRHKDKVLQVNQLLVVHLHQGLGYSTEEEKGGYRGRLMKSKTQQQQHARDDHPPNLFSG